MKKQKISCRADIYQLDVTNRYYPGWVTRVVLIKEGALIHRVCNGQLIPTMLVRRGKRRMVKRCNSCERITR
jgi:hypothetical protein